ncbi:MAG: cupin domain-containing protein [Pseudomonadota bacterium]
MPTASIDTDYMSHHVKPAEMDWTPTKFHGVDMKPLLIDKATGMVTALVRMAPGAILPDHEHVGIEQTWVIEGKLVDTEGPDTGLAVDAGEYVSRPAGSRHAAWTPDGGIMLAMFTLPNKFFEADGEVVDVLGNDWEATWGKGA